MKHIAGYLNWTLCFLEAYDVTATEDLREVRVEKLAGVGVIGRVDTLDVPGNDGHGYRRHHSVNFLVLKGIFHTANRDRFM